MDRAVEMVYSTRAEGNAFRKHPREPYLRRLDRVLQPLVAVVRGLACDPDALVGGKRASAGTSVRGDGEEDGRTGKKRGGESARSRQSERGPPERALTSCMISSAALAAAFSASSSACRSPVVSFAFAASFAAFSKTLEYLANPAEIAAATATHTQHPRSNTQANTATC